MSLCLCNCHLKGTDAQIFPENYHNQELPCCADIGKPFVYAEVKGGQYKPGDILDVKVLNAS